MTTHPITKNSERRTIHLGILSKSGLSEDAVVTIQVWVDDSIDDPCEYGFTKFEHCDALDIYGANAVIHWHKFLKNSIFHEADVVNWILDVQSMTENQYLLKGFDYRSNADEVLLYASLSTLSVQHLLGNVRRLPLPASFKQWIEVSTAVHSTRPFRWWNDLVRSIKLNEAVKSGQLHPDFCYNLELGIA